MIDCDCTVGIHAVEQTFELVHRQLAAAGRVQMAECGNSLVGRSSELFAETFDPLEE